MLFTIDEAYDFRGRKETDEDGHLSKIIIYRLFSFSFSY
jgi:hypothetical protein